MKSTDKFLIGIVAGSVLLVVVAFVITLARPEASYRTEDTPEGVAHNYLLALQRDEFARAYGYLSPTLPSYPDDETDFARHIDDQPWMFRRYEDVTLSVESAKVSGDRATVQVRESQFRGGDLFDSSQSSSTFDMTLEREGGVWKIVDAEHYFARCWDYAGGCR
jgi:hypothetical protein